MESINIYRFTDYRVIIEKLISLAKSKSKDFTLTKLASVIGIQATYLSKVLKGKAEFNSDQMHLLCDFFELNKSESHYMNLLLEYNRTALKNRQKALKSEIEEIQKASLSTKKYLKARFVEGTVNDDELKYYLEPYSLVVHCYLMIDKYRHNPELILSSLQISDEQLGSILHNLVKIGVVKKSADNTSYEVLENHRQLSGDSPIVNSYQQLIRQISLLQSGKVSQDNKFIFSTTIAADERTKVAIKEEFMNFLKKIEPLIKEAPYEDVYQINFDLFNWSK